MQKVQFKRVGVNEAGDAVFDLWIDGAPAERDLTIDEVVRRISESEDAPDRSPAERRTPEDRRGTWQRRECPKAF